MEGTKTASDSTLLITRMPAPVFRLIVLRVGWLKQIPVSFQCDADHLAAIFHSGFRE